MRVKSYGGKDRMKRSATRNAFLSSGMPIRHRPWTSTADAFAVPQRGVEVVPSVPIYRLSIQFAIVAASLARSVAPNGIVSPHPGPGVLVIF